MEGLKKLPFYYWKYQCQNWGTLPVTLQQLAPQELRTATLRKSPDPDLETDGKMVNIRTVPVKTIPRSVQFQQFLNDKQNFFFWTFLDIKIKIWLNRDSRMLAWSNTFPSCSQLMVEDIAGDCWAGADLSDLVQFLITPRRPSFILCHFLLPAVRGSCCC